MPRKRPSILRQSRVPKVMWHDVPHVPGLDRRSQYEICSIEWKTARDWAGHGFWPGAIGEALSAWRRIANHPQIRVALPCSCCGRHPRALLHEALNTLTGPARTALSELISPLDEEFRQRTVLDPHLPVDWSWWDRRAPL